MSSDDFWELSNLVARYAELLNLGQIEALGALFEHGRISSSNIADVHVGPAAVTEMYRRSVVFPEKVPDTLLFTSNLQFRIDGDEASGKACFMAVHQAEAGVVPVLAGRYHDEFRKIDGRWWFHHRHMLPDLVGDLSTHLHEPLEGV
ncbi:SnoaL-like domain-containing protein [Parafrankia irregularis]|uniref:SnoaL-like domain-containing protein n=1 Tax=Parafrankia irregularis TaxID=795642 RepID=A0A0S4QMF3_9ACTN|nr:MULTISPECIES: nuclear transport factor 2 family protein [Parafrankia]MBE3200149.1 nuclear transport factor 2 family protein [Parafrankia sp. CH37]CUU56659.1 SnoaL-like domain-containing protein [Parafrankia irregularis]